MTHTGDATGPATLPDGGIGQPRVDAALAELSRLPDLPVDEHVAVFDAIHQGLLDSLGDAAGTPTAEPV